MEERKKRELTTPTKPASKKKAQFETPKKIRQKFKELQIIDDLNYDLPDQVIQNRTCGEASFSVLDTNSEDRVQEQATCISNFSTKTTATTLNSSISLLMLRTGCPLLQEELLLYALVSISFPENQFNFKAKSKEKYDPIIGVIHNVYHTRFNNHNLKNYFQRASHNLVKDLGKVKGVLRWVYYKNRLIEVLEKFKVLLTELLLGNVVPCDQIEELRHFISEQCEQIDSGEPNQEKPEVKLVSDDFNEQIQTEDVSELHILKEFPKWKANYCEDKNSVHFFYFSGNIGYAEIEVIINSDKSWTVVLDGIVRSTASLNWADIPSYLSNLSELQELLTIIQNSRICKGCPLEPFIDIVSNDTSKPVFYTKDREPSAYVDIKLSHFHEKVIRSTSCSVFLPGMDDLVCSKSMCDLCSKTQHYLRTKKSRVKNKNVLEEARAAQHNFVVMSKEELLTVARKQSNELRNLHKQIQRLEKHREKMNEVGEKTNSDLKFMFDKLTKGIDARNERLQNPICMWKGCNEKFSNVDVLYSHVKDHIPDFASSVAPINRSYSCLWEKCEKKFTKKKLLQNHIIDHTGSTSDQFFEILLNDQAKALTVPSRQMRWHPLVIKWCLRIYSKSHSVYEDMKESGFIKLPSGRTLSDYKNFCSPKSGWNTASIIAMKDKFEKMKLKKYAKIGALIFDEIKIKEGLVFDPSTWELIGFTDLDDNCDNSKHTPVKEQPEEKLATHILQFFFKSLFAKFDFPLCYFLTKGITAQKLNRVFWQGVSLLHCFEFTTLLSICDGASENRAFISINGTDASKSKGMNLFSGCPIFFFSDPPHLIKKLRNNLFKSGFKENSTRYTRTLKLNNKYILWDHIYSVYEREKRRRLYATPLRRAHVHLDNLSKMRVKLAVNTLSKSVAHDMREHENIATQSTQLYITMCNDFWEIFNDRQPIASVQDPRIAQLDQILTFFNNWKTSLQQEFATRAEVSSHFITWQTMFDLQVTIHALKGLLEYIQSPDFKNRFPGNDLYLVLKRLNQDCVESFFSVQRQMCGGTQNMTAFTYGYNLAGNISFTSSQLVSKKQTNVFETEECLRLADSSKNLPRRQTGEGIYEKVVWPVRLT